MILIQFEGNQFPGGPQLPLLLLTERTWSGDDRVGLQRGEYVDDGDEHNISSAM